MKKKKIIFNWKLNGNKYTIKCFINKVTYFIKENLEKINKNNIEILISPPIIYLDYVNNLLNNNVNIKLCSQNTDINYLGPFTGEISLKMLKDINVKYVIIGHSERKKFHNENKDIISKKFYISKISNIEPILCIGYEKNILNQIEDIINKYGINILYNTNIAYEPISSIGTGIIPSIDHINNINNMILNFLYKFDKNIKNNINILYGGSVSYKNVYNLIFKTNINGLLIGKSSTKIFDIIKIIKNIILI
ncbi:triose-phosphate isomerase [Candidatus Nardonella dryophthoridicola]|uniref:Triosephosphate isomerase n=1 Tax=endosymbiont of Rhynchophorus ferrugineus TaxID=1972133 RepID=A0A2Z5TGR7_9GAMM|nr:triose-phosphate isomerase [Candidatus Nardonella dryophthoridicola]BBA85033.1 triosephosphate isomerase [endosymbiont of Rhynchophorus ferrugineus]